MKKMVMKGFAGAKALGYLLRHPLKGTRNLLALKGAKSLLQENRKTAVAAAAVVTAAVAAPIAARALKKDSESED